jgi:hypothetical protein
MTAFTTLKTAVFTPIPRASVNTAAAVKTGDFRRSRVVKTTSCRSVSTLSRSWSS